MAVILETSLGDVTIDLMTDERPRCCLNFLKLCKMKYYNFALFHSVQRNLVAQAGDPTYTGKGGESIFYHLYGEQAKYFEAETKPRIKHRDRGVVSMVNNGKNQHGSQFFITLAKNLDYLDGVHTVFGEVTEGFEILDKINEAHTDNTHRPYVDIRIYHTAIIDDPFDDPKGLRIPSQSPEPTREQLASVRIAPDEEIDDAKGKSKDEIEEMEREKEAKKDAMLLEMVGDLPDQEVKPPDNVLFVCKLNPVTTEEDLEIIFSRFGKIDSCEVIKDQKSGESLQYAFVEFESPDSCEKAYFKMDNVLIDDRRIHVDFSQSVSKMKWRGKGKGVEYVKPDRRDDRTRNVNNRGRGRSPPKPRSPVKSKSPVRNKSGSRRDDTPPRHKKSKKDSRSRSRTPKRKNASRSRSRTAERKKKPSRSRSRTPERKKKVSRSRSRTPERKKKVSRSRSRTPERKKKPGRSRSRTPKRKKKASRSRSRSPKRRKNDRSRSKTPERKKNDRRSRSRTPEPKKKDSRHRSSSEETPVKKRRSGSTDRRKSKKKKKDISRSRSRSKERSSKKRRDKSSSESPPRKKKSSKSSRRSPSPKKSKSKSRHRSPSASPPRRRKRDSSSDSSDDDRRRRNSKKSR